MSPPANPFPNGRPASGQVRATAWVSRSFAELAHDLAVDPERGAFRARHGVDFDVLIVGSGYGGAIAAAELAGHTADDSRALRIGVLERGREYLPGAFPTRMADLAGHVRFSTPEAKQPRGVREGLFDVRAGTDIATVVASGLGGGSLINAGVMLAPTESVLARRCWPAEIRADDTLPDWYARARVLVGAARSPAARPNTILDHPDGAPPKYRALQRLAHQAPHARFGPVPITVAMRAGVSSGGVALEACVRCGDCATGCNFGAKDSLDVNLLARAARAGVEVYTGATAIRLEPADDGAGWRLFANHTDEKLRARQRVVPVRARRVVLAAGTLGSTELLLRSRSARLVLSPALGDGFSGNGDMIAAVYRRTHPTQSVGDEDAAPALRDIGPTITGLVDLRDDPLEPIAIEELAIPGPLRRLLEESLATTDTLTQLGRFAHGRHRVDDDGRDPAAVDPDAVARTSIVAMMGDDGAAGRIVPVSEALDDDDGDGTVTVRWPGLADHPLFARQIATLERLVPDSEARAAVFPHPLWQPIPPNVASVIGTTPGPLLTVHPLGGCRMADDPRQGVVDGIGRVYVDEGGRWVARDDLVVLDGSIVPTSLGVNPALTIAMLALRAVGTLRDRVWRLGPPGRAARSADATTLPVLERPRRRPIDPYAAPPRPVDTELEVLERLVGRVDLEIAGNAQPFVVELTLRFLPAPIGALMSRLDRSLELRTHGNPDFPETNPLDEGTTAFGSRIRVYTLDDWHDLFGDPATREDLALPARGPAAERLRRREAYVRDRERCLDERAALRAPLSGNLRFLHRAKSSAFGRVLAALPAWALNRGLRDVWQSLEDCVRSLVSGGRGHGVGMLDWIRQLGPLLSRAGEVRLFDYELRIGEPEGAVDPRLRGIVAGDRRIVGAKRLSYTPGGNPWQQLQTVELERFPLLAPHLRRRHLVLDAAWLARVGTPLVRVTQQNSQPDAIVDMGAFLAYLLRLLVHLHVWSFRKPDEPRRDHFDSRRRLPAALPGISGFTPITLDTGERWGPRDEPVQVLLSRYRLAAGDALARGPRRGLRRTSAPLDDPGGERRNPVVLLHGYSASGSTYAHPAVRPNLVRRLCALGRDVWVVDLRTSAGLPSAVGDWRIEDVAFRDIPLALERIRAQRRAEGADERPIDVVAHCMGAVMFSMAVMRPDDHDGPCRAQLEALPGWLGRVVLSQAGPAIEFSPANVFRAYAMNYLRHFLGMRDYRFRPDDLASGSGSTDPAPVAIAAAGLLDRGLSSMPYPAGEFFLENPLLPWRRAAFCRARHRIDALYGRSFSLRNMPARVLEHIDELFGPLSIETVAQTIPMARQRRITDPDGRPYDLSPNALRRRWTFDTLHVHAGDNGLLDPATQVLLQSLFAHPAMAGARGRMHFVRLPGVGHQDAMIGRRAPEVFAEIEAFLR